MLTETIEGPPDLARKMATAKASSDARDRSLNGKPRLRSESYSNGAYTGIFEFEGNASLAPPPWESARSSAGTDDGPKTAAESHATAVPWILVIPVDATGGTPVWGHQTPWSNAWIVPDIAGHTRLIATTGDADDRKRLPEESLRDPGSREASSGARNLALKYGAPAVAIVENDKIGARIWLWDHGHLSTDSTDSTDNLTARKSALRSLLAQLVNVSPANDRDTDDPDDHETGDVAGSQRSDGPSAQTGDAIQAPLPTIPASLTVFAPVDGDLEATLIVDAGDEDFAVRARRILRNMADFEVEEFTSSENGLKAKGWWTGKQGEEGLKSALVNGGFRLRKP